MSHFTISLFSTMMITYFFLNVWVLFFSLLVDFFLLFGLFFVFFLVQPLKR